jgi:DNA-binding MarR family transcriptional regulator
MTPPPQRPGVSGRSRKSPEFTTAQFRQLSEMRYQLLKFLHFSQDAADRAGIRPQQHQLLLAVHGMPLNVEPSIANVAQRMLLKHNSAVELVDRTIDLGFLRRTHDLTDHRRILLRLTPEGERLLRSLTEHHVAELEVAGPRLIEFLRLVIGDEGTCRIGEELAPSAASEAKS